MDPEPGANLQLILGAWFTAMTTGDPEPLASILHPDVVWNGPHPWQSCRGRDQAFYFLAKNVTEPRRITSLQAREKGEQVTMTAEGPDFYDIGEDGEMIPKPSATLIFTIEDGQIVNMQGA